MSSPDFTFSSDTQVSRFSMTIRSDSMQAGSSCSTSHM